MDEDLSYKGLSMQLFLKRSKGRFHLRFSGIHPLRGYPLPLLTENQSEKKVFFLSKKGGYPPTVDKKGGVGATTLSHLSSRYC